MTIKLTEKQTRSLALERQIKRLQKRIATLDHQSNRIGWTRVAIFFTGALLSILVYFLVGWWLLLIGVVFTLTISASLRIFMVVLTGVLRVTKSGCKSNQLI